MLHLTSAQMSLLSRFWDEALGTGERAREAWLTANAADEFVRAAVGAMLARDGNDDPFMAGLPALDGLANELDNQCGPVPGDIVGPYELMALLGRGGMGTVWRAERTDCMIKRTVALKLPHPWLRTPQFIARFERERKILDSLTHPNIARLYDAGVTDSRQPFLALELVEGEDILTYCRKRQLDVGQMLELFLQVADAVHFAHEHSVIHRDLKPSNLLVSADGRVHLLDFGIAKLMEEDAQTSTEFGGGALTPTYASPEQILGQPVNVASDVYSLGVVLYEMLTGERPHPIDGPTRRTLEDENLKDDVIAPSVAVRRTACAAGLGMRERRRASTLKGDVDTIVLTALKREPTRRYVSAQALAADLRRHLAGERILVRPDIWHCRASKFLIRYRDVALAATLAFAGMASSIVIALHVAREADDLARETAMLSRTGQASLPVSTEEVQAALARSSAPAS